MTSVYVSLRPPSLVAVRSSCLARRGKSSFLVTAKPEPAWCALLIASGARTEADPKSRPLGGSTGRQASRHMPGRLRRL